MLLNLTDIFLSEGKELTKSIPVEINEFTSALGTFPILEKSDLELTLTNVGTGKALVEGKAELLLDMNCDRCLKQVPTKVKLDFSREFFAPDYVYEDSEGDDQIYMIGYQLDIDALMSNEILMNWPLKVLCKEDCKGICMVCGQDLNVGECGCDTFVPDPRMAVIKDIFNANKEV